MVDDLDGLNGLFKALADPTRRAILDDLRGGPLTISALAQPHDMTLAGASKHVRVLEGAGLVIREKVGREYHCQLKAAGLEAASLWLETYASFWNRRLDLLANQLQKTGE